MTYKSKDPEYYTDQLNRAMVNDLLPAEFNARSLKIIRELKNLSTASSVVVPWYCIPKVNDFLRSYNSDEPTIEDVYLYHGESHQVYPLPDSRSRHTQPSSVLHHVVKTSLDGQVGYAFAAPEIHLNHYEAVFVPIGKAVILHTYTNLSAN